MRTFQTALTSSGSASFALGAFAACALWLPSAGAAVAQTPARPEAAMRQAKSATTTTPDQEDESESESGGDSALRERPRTADPSSVLRTARLVYVNSDTAFVSPREVEASLLKRKEFRAWGMAVTRNPNEADLIIEITRKSLTRRFTFTVIDPRTMAVVTSGKTRSVLFGKKIPNKIAEKFTNRLRAVRPYPPVAASP